MDLWSKVTRGQYEAEKKDNGGKVYRLSSQETQVGESKATRGECDECILQVQERGGAVPVRAEPATHRQEKTNSRGDHIKKLSCSGILVLF